jgi:hypothetical protein
MISSASLFQRFQYPQEVERALQQSFERRDVVGILQNRDVYTLFFIRTLRVLSQRHPKILEEWKIHTIVYPEAETKLIKKMEMIRTSCLNQYKDKKPICFFEIQPHMMSSITLIQVNKNEGSDYYIGSNDQEEAGKFSGDFEYSSLFFPTLDCMIRNLGGQVQKEIWQKARIHKRATYSETEGRRRVEKDACTERLEGTILKIQFDIRKPDVVPLSTHSLSNLGNELHALYRAQSECDIALTFKDGEIRLHSLILFNRGGDVFRTCLKGPMKEAIEKKIALPGCSMKTGSILVDFLYLGVDSISEKTLASAGADPYELLEMVHLYDIQPLITCSVNIICETATLDNVALIGSLAERFGNETLAKLLQYWTNPHWGAPP